MVIIILPRALVHLEWCFQEGDASRLKNMHKSQSTPTVRGTWPSQVFSDSPPRICILMHVFHQCTIVNIPFRKMTYWWLPQKASTAYNVQCNFNFYLKLIISAVRHHRKLHFLFCFCFFFFISSNKFLIIIFELCLWFCWYETLTDNSSEAAISNVKYTWMHLFMVYD